MDERVRGVGVCVCVESACGSALDVFFGFYAFLSAFCSGSARGYADQLLSTLSPPALHWVNPTQPKTIHIFKPHPVFLLPLFPFSY